MHVFTKDEDSDPGGSVDFWAAGSGSVTFFTGFGSYLEVGSDFFSAEPDSGKKKFGSSILHTFYMFFLRNLTYDLQT